MNLTVPAADLLPGDVVHYNARVSWRVASVERTEKTSTIRGTYAKCDFADCDQTGKPMHWRFRNSTKVAITRPER